MAKAMPPAAIGVRVKSGWAAAVLVTGPTRAPRVLDARILTLSDPEVPASRQPHHAGFGTAQTDSARVKQLVRVVERCAQRSIAQLARDYRAAGHRIRAMGLVVGSDIDPATIANPHIRAHASEGRLFRRAVERAARKCGLATATFLEKHVLEETAAAVRRRPAELRRTVTALGRPLPGRWRAEEKTATLAAWLVLAAS